MIQRSARSGRFAAARALDLVAVLAVVSIAVFVATQVAPGDPARLRLGPRASEAAVAQLQHQLGTDRSLPAQYVSYVGDALRGDFGETVDGQTVSSVIAERAPVTLQLVLGGMIAAVVIAVPFAMLAATRRDRPADHGIRVGALLMLFLPSFWVGFVLIRFVALPTGWFPVAGLGDSPVERLRSLVLPSLTIGIAAAPVLIRSLRASLIEVLESEYVTVARSIGVGRLRLALRHVLRNAAGPAIVLLAVQLGLLLFGVVMIESTFDIPGLGQALVDGARQRDVFLVQGITLVFAACVVLVNALGDLAGGLLDPRVRQR